MRKTLNDEWRMRRTQIAKSGTMMAEDEVQDYGYNTRDELISGQGLVYNYDDIGNRTTAEGKVYTANNLNQYTTIDTFEPQYDADGNQTLIKTSTGIWSVTYNAENRPVRWERGNTVITMDFDRMGRRVFYKEEVNGEVVAHHKFVYDNYLCVQKLDALNNNSQINLFVWDPTEPVATRPLFMLANPGNYKLFYTFDGNKNVSELVHFESRNGIAAHYDYAPFGAVTRAVNISAISARNFHLENPFRFSSEYHDDTLGLVYYNYRHYNPIDGRWCGRDLVEESNENLYSMCKNEVGKSLDYLGLSIVSRLRCWWNGCDKTTSVDLNKVYLPDETDFEVRSDYTNYKIFIAGPTGQGPGIGDSSLLLNFYMKNQSGWTSLWKSPEMKEMLKNRTLYGWRVNCRKRYLCAVKQICYKESPNCPCATWESAMPVYYIGIVRLKNKYRLEFYCDTFPDSLFVDRDCERTYVEQK